MPQIRTRQPQIASMLANAESVKPDVPQPPLPDIKSKQKYIAAQQPTQVTPVQANPQQAVRQTGRKAVHGESKLCQPPIASETVTVPTSRNVTPVKPVRVQKRARPTFVKKRKIKSLKVVYSKELPLTPIDDTTISCRTHCICPPGTARKCTQRRQVPGSNAFVPSTVGLIIAGEVIKDLTGVRGNGIGA